MREEIQLAFSRAKYTGGRLWGIDLPGLYNQLEAIFKRRIHTVFLARPAMQTALSTEGLVVDAHISENAQHKHARPDRQNRQWHTHLEVFEE